jgi:hypothetical protein
MKLALGAACCLAILIAASGAQAAQHYAAPTGSGTACTQAAPCSLSTALTEAKANDEVIVGGGTYTTAGPLISSFEATNVYVHGDFGGPMPVLQSANGAPVIYLPTQGSRLAYLDVRNSGENAQGAACVTKSTIERVRATVSGKNTAAISVHLGCTVRDSLAIASGENSVALDGSAYNPTSGSATARNVTAIATGSGSAGARSRNFEFINPTTFTLDVGNSILSGQGADVLATQEPSPGNLVVGHSNFDLPKANGSATVTDAGGNQTAAPLFVDAAGGDYREAAGSPTIDAGIADQLGALDLAGNPRTVGAAPDIGAFEFVPPAGELRSIVFKPLAFRTANAGGAVISRKKKPKAPVGSTVIYNLSAPATVDFTLERAFRGRRVGGKCYKVTKANRAKKKCTLYKPIKGGFSVTGTAPLNNSFRFSGRIENRALKPGTYKLVGHCGTTLKRGLFKIVR